MEQALRSVSLGSNRLAVSLMLPRRAKNHAGCCLSVCRWASSAIHSCRNNPELATNSLSISRRWPSFVITSRLSPVSNTRASAAVMPRSRVSSPHTLGRAEPPLTRPVRRCHTRPAHALRLVRLECGANDFGWTDGGSLVPAEKSVGDAFAKLFAEDGTANKTKVLREIGRGKSILDHVLDEARDLQTRLSQRDQDKLAEYFESVRATEKRLVKSEEWMHQPKPKVNAKPPVSFAPDEIITNLRGVCDLTYLAFKTDSTRVITFGYFRQDTVVVPGVNIGYHNLSHTAQDEGNIAQLNESNGRSSTS